MTKRTDLWSDAWTNHLILLHSNGLSYETIAAKMQKRFRRPFTRQGIGGKVRRLKAEGRLLARRSNRPALIERPKPIPRPRVAPAPVLVPISKSLPLLQLTDRTCKYPDGGPTEPAKTFCGNHAALGDVYCRFHFDLCNRPIQPLRRAA